MRKLNDDDNWKIVEIKTYAMNVLARKIQLILDKWDSIEDPRAAICAALYISDRKLTREEIEFGTRLLEQDAHRT